MSMRQFLEDAEKENEKETGACDAELEVMDSTSKVKDKVTKSASEKTGEHDSEIMDSSTPAQKVGAQKETIMALNAV